MKRFLSFWAPFSLAFFCSVSTMTAETEVGRVLSKAWTGASDKIQEFAERALTGVDNQLEKYQLLVRFYKEKKAEGVDSGPFFYRMSQRTADGFQHKMGIVGYLASVAEGRDNLYVEAVPVKLPETLDTKNFLQVHNFKDKMEVVVKKEGMIAGSDLFAKEGTNAAQEGFVKITNTLGAPLLLEVKYGYKPLLIPRLAEKVDPIKRFWLVEKNASIVVSYKQQKLLFKYILSEIEVTKLKEKKASLYRLVETAPAVIVYEKEDDIQMVPCSFDSDGDCVVE